MIKILLVDDHAVVRDGLRLLIERTVDMCVQAEAETVAAALAIVEADPPDLVLLDLALPDRTGMEALNTLRRQRPALPVLIFSGFSEETYAISCLQAGALGYLNKDSDPDTIRAALRQVAKGERYVSSRVATSLLNATITPTLAAPHMKLSRRELDVMIRISRGQSLMHIASELSLSSKTISAHRANILEKMDLESNADLIKYVLAHQLDPLGPSSYSGPR